MEIDVDVLRRAAETLRTAAPALDELTRGAGRSAGDASADAGVTAVSVALADFQRRWDAGVGSLAGRIDAYGVMLRATIDAHVADDEAGAAAFGGTPPPR